MFCLHYFHFLYYEILEHFEAGKRRGKEMQVVQIDYSDKYFCKNYEYRHVMLPPDLARKVPRTHLMTETEWRNLGVQQSPGWVHFMIHSPEPHILLFRRPRTDVNGNGDGPPPPPPDIVNIRR